MTETKLDNMARHVSSAKTQNAPIESDSPEASVGMATAMPNRYATKTPDTGRHMERSPKAGNLLAGFVMPELTWFELFPGITNRLDQKCPSKSRHGR
jgi:hypothetical protein